jgi:RNA polymerase sigma-70 factor (sigma-E family)
MREEGRESFETWARARQQTLVRWAYVVTGDFQRAEDLVQEALVRAATRWDTLSEGNPDAWVRTVVFRDNVSWWRRHRRERLTGEPFGGTAPAGPDTESAVVLHAALARLTRAQRAVLVLRFVADLSVADTAATLGVTEGTVKKQSSVALARLREIAPELSDLVEDLS